MAKTKVIKYYKYSTLPLMYDLQRRKKNRDYDFAMINDVLYTKY